MPHLRGIFGVRRLDAAFLFCVRTGSGSDRIKFASDDDHDPVATALGFDTFELLR